MRTLWDAGRNLGAGQISPSRARAQAAQSARQEMGGLQQAAEQEQLEDKKARRLEQLKGSTPEALQIMREAVGDNSGHYMVASHGQVGPAKGTSC